MFFFSVLSNDNIQSNPVNIKKKTSDIVQNGLSSIHDNNNTYKSNLVESFVPILRLNLPQLKQSNKKRMFRIFEWILKCVERQYKIVRIYVRYRDLQRWDVDKLGVQLHEPSQERSILKHSNETYKKKLINNN